MTCRLPFIVFACLISLGSSKGQYLVKGQNASHASWLFKNSAISAIITKDHTVLVGTYENGLFLSRDEGTTWEPASVGLGTSLILSLAEEDSIFLAGTGEGVFKSTDNGASWASSSSGLPSGDIISLAAQNQTVLAGTNDGLFRSTDAGTTWSKTATFRPVALIFDRTSILAGTSFGVFRSSDGGSTWVSSNSGLTSSILYSLARNESQVFAATLGGVFMSTDGGVSWLPRNSSPMSSNGIFSICFIGSHLYAGSSGNGVLVSPDTGQTWMYANNGLTNPFVYALGGNDSALFAGTGGGLFRTTDRGKTWEASDLELGFGLVRAFLVHQANVMAGTSGGFLLRSPNGSWTRKNKGLTNTDIYALAAIDSDWFAGTRSGGIARSTNEGTTWMMVNTGLTDTLVQALVVKDTILYAGTNANGVFRSSNRGATWMPAGPLDATGVSVLSLAQYRGDLFAGTGGGIFVSSDNGNTWTTANNGLAWGYIVAILVTGDTLFAAAGSGGGVYRSTDGGVSWWEVNEGLTNHFVYCMTAGAGKIFAGTYGGIFVSSDGGNQWFPLDTAFSQIEVTSLVVVGSDIFAGTKSGIVQRSLETGTTSADHSTGNWEFTLMQNYPNPFNPVTEIRYQMSEVGRVVLKVYDVLGREVATLVNGEREAGTHRVRWDAAGLPSGVYVYRLKANEFVGTKKMLLVR